MLEALNVAHGGLTFCLEVSVEPNSGASTADIDAKRNGLRAFTKGVFRTLAFIHR